jgi:DNA-binding NarL/FixJ family response regulator
MAPIRIVVSDDHTLFRFGLRTMLSAEPDLELVGEATTGEEVVTLAGALRPDIILMDLNMPGMSGIEATRRLSADYPEVKVLVLTMFDDDSVFAAMRAGARGYVLKGAGAPETLRAIRAVAAGEAIFSPTITERLVRHFAGYHEQAEVFPALTVREREVLGLVARGLTNNAIAERLSLSPKTVRNLVSSIFDKLQVVDRSEAIVRAREAGLGK